MYTMSGSDKYFREKAGEEDMESREAGIEF